MPHITAHRPGSFSWIELATTDQNAAKTFYPRLFGWDIHDAPMAPGEVYTIFRLDGRDAAAAYAMRPDQRAQGVPPHWMIYIAVENADAAADRATRAGGTVLAPAFDVMDAGRMAVVRDPTGAVFAVWQAKKHSGTGIAGVSGTLCAADLDTPDRERAAPFYSTLFGWKIMKEDEEPAHNYWHFFNGEEFIGGVLPAHHRAPNAPAHWLPYFAVGDCNASAAEATRLGARTYLPPTTLENVGRYAVLADPQGAVFAIFQPGAGAA